MRQPHERIDPRELVELALHHSRADQCLVVLADETSTNLRWAHSAATTNGRARRRNMTVIALDKRTSGAGIGIASRTITDPRDVDDVVRAADLACRRASSAEGTAGFAEAVDAQWPGADNPNECQSLSRVASELKQAFDRFDLLGQSLFGYAEHCVTQTYLASSTGIRRSFEQPDGRVELTARSQDGRTSVWQGSHVPDLDGFELAATLESLETRLRWSASALELPAGRYATILPPEAVADLMVVLYNQTSARAAAEGRGPFGRNGTSHMGDQLSGLPLTLRSDPLHDDVACLPFAVVTDGESDLASVFDNGSPLEATSWIDRGRVATLVAPTSWAQANDVTPAPRIDNLIFESGSSLSLDEMIASTEHGLLLTSLWYIREVDPATLLLTGMTRDGVYLIDDGVVKGAVNNFRFNESPIDLLRRATEVGKSQHAMPRERADAFRRTVMPTLRVPDFLMSSVSTAN